MRSLLHSGGFFILIWAILACGDTTLPADPCEYQNLCEPGQRCYIGDCFSACKPGETACGRLCANLTNNKFNCGKCGKRCAAGDICIQGLCRKDCPPKLPNCQRKPPPPPPPPPRP